jgi:CheY-like chemotaxis protein
MAGGNDSLGFLDGAEELQRLREMFAHSPSFSALLHGPEHRFALINPAYQQLVGHRDVVGLTVREAIPEVASQGFLVLPHVNGRKLAEMARTLRPNLKVLFVSGYAEDATFRGDFLDPGMDMLTKPFALGALRAKVHAMIDR